ncbi:transcriptional regulator, LacI family [Mycetocola miduiensis]|uniref:Transcriptional regulator, LacI family n=1 Tax=Mycetocola miduiensis TaxID=995034 RepID=A0A1I5C4K7_9MICO|nr:transcriptional regulator, LacI family [Mycetocola miduiensis]
MTVADVAREAGVAKATASRALGGYGAVSDEARDRVLAAAEALGYRPNELARSMNTGKSKTIGVVVGDIENGYFGLAMRGISDAAKRAGYDIILVNTSEDVEAEIDAVRLLLDKRVDGLIVAPASAYRTEHLREVHQSGHPLVLLDRRIESLPAVSVGVDIAPAARAATRALVAEGHRRIAFVSALGTDGERYSGLPLGVSSVTDRLVGILQGLEETGIPISPELIRFEAHGAEKTHAVIADLLALSEPPTAILLSDSLVALNVLLAFRELGIKVPRDVSVVAFDDVDWAAITDPPMTVVSQPIYDVGVTAAEELLRLMRGMAPDATTLRLPAALVERDSIGPVAVSAQ